MPVVCCRRIVASGLLEVHIALAQSRFMADVPSAAGDLLGGGVTVLREAVFDVSGGLEVLPSIHSPALTRTAARALSPRIPC